MSKKTRTLKNLRAMSHDQLEDIMVELRDQVEAQCEWGSGMDDVDPRFKTNVEEARDLCLGTKYLETKQELIEYIRRADTVLMCKMTLEAMYNFSF